MVIRTRVKDCEKKNLAVNLWEEDVELLRAHCVSQGITTSILLRSLINAYIEDVIEKES